jgi:hypothetical protein
VAAARDRSCYLPRDVFFGRLGFAGAFFTVWASDFGRFLPATSDSFPIGVLSSAPYRARPRAVPLVRFRWPRSARAAHAELLETVDATRWAAGKASGGEEGGR